MLWKHVFTVFIKQKNVFGIIFQITCFSMWKNIMVCLVCVCIFFFFLKLTSGPPGWNWRMKWGWQFCPAPLWPAPPPFTPCGFSPPRKGGEARMGWNFRPAPQGRAGMGLHVLDPPHPTPSPPRPALIRIKL